MKKMIELLLIVVLMCGSARAVAETIGYTGFEEPGGNGSYIYTATTPMYLPNTASVNVNYSSVGGELGFQTWYNGTDGPTSGSESGDYLGVQNYYNYAGNGSYEMEDCDPECQLEIDAVDVSNYHDVIVSAYLKIMGSYGFEDGDVIRVYVLIDGTQEIELFNMGGDDLNAYYVEHGYDYVQYQAIIPNTASSVQFIAQCISNGSSEGLQIDDVYVTGEPGPSVDPVCIPVDSDLSGDCVVNVDDLVMLAENWTGDGYDLVSADPNYAQHAGWDWSDGDSTFIETYAVGTAVNEPNDTASGRVVKLIQGNEALDANDEMYVSKFYLARIEGLEDGDKIYVTAKMKSGDPSRWMSLFADHIRYGAYAGGAIYKNIESYHEWGLFTAEYTFDAGDLTQYDPRTGMRIAIQGEFSYGETLAEGDVFGYIDELTVSAPYRETGGAPTVTIEFAPTLTENPNYGNVVNPADLPEICVSNPAEDLNNDCSVNLEDFSIFGSEWLDCGWDPATLCP